MKYLHTAYTVFNNTLICFLAKRQMRKSISLSCQCIKYEATARRLLAYFGIKTESRWKQLAMQRNGSAYITSCKTTNGFCTNHIIFFFLNLWTEPGQQLPPASNFYTKVSQLSLGTSLASRYECGIKFLSARNQSNICPKMLNCFFQVLLYVGCSSSNKADKAEVVWQAPVSILSVSSHTGKLHKPQKHRSHPEQSIQISLQYRTTFFIKYFLFILYIYNLLYI